MVHPVRTLMYELLIEPMVELWQRVRGIVYPAEDAGANDQQLRHPNDREALPTRHPLPKP